MSKMIICSYNKAEAAFKAYRPEFVVSILGKDERPAPRFDGLPPEHLIEMCGNHSDADENSERCSQLINLARRWDRSGPILIHCWQGVARSTAAAYIILCTAQQGRCEFNIAQQLRAAAPHADPNILLISQADALLGRGDRMVGAILDLCPRAGGDFDDIVILPVAT